MMGINVSTNCTLNITSYIPNDVSQKSGSTFTVIHYNEVLLHFMTLLNYISNVFTSYISD